MTYAEINHELGLNVAKSTLSYICRDIKLPKSYHERIKLMNSESLILARSQARRVLINSQQKTILELKERARNLTQNVSSKDAYNALAMLYLGEGSKRSSFRGLSLGSSDPKIIRLYISLLKRVFDIPSTRLKARVMYRADQNISHLVRYWSTVTRIPEANFYKTKPDMRTLGKPTKKPGYKGVCAIYCAGADKQLELQIYAEIFAEKIWGRSSVD